MLSDILLPDTFHYNNLHIFCIFLPVLAKLSFVAGASMTKYRVRF